MSLQPPLLTWTALSPRRLTVSPPIWVSPRRTALSRPVEARPWGEVEEAPRVRSRDSTTTATTTSGILNTGCWTDSSTSTTHLFRSRVLRRRRKCSPSRVWPGWGVQYEEGICQWHIPRSEVYDSALVSFFLFLFFMMNTPFSAYTCHSVHRVWDGFYWVGSGPRTRKTTHKIGAEVGISDAYGHVYLIIGGFQIVGK